MLTSSRKQGISMRSFVNKVRIPLRLRKITDSLKANIQKSKPEDSPDYNWSEVLYEGNDGDDLLEVPAHWHRVRGLVLSSLTSPQPKYENEWS